MPFFAAKTDRYPESTASAENLVKRYGIELSLAACSVLEKWINDDLQPGSKEVEMPGTPINKEMVNEVETKLSCSMTDMEITRCWISARKAGYREVRDGCFELFAAKVRAAAERRSR